LGVYAGKGEKTYAFADAAVAFSDHVWVGRVYHGDVHGEGDFAAVAATSLDFAVFDFTFWKRALVRMRFIRRAQSPAVETSKGEHRNKM
jgi:hypothetical protein